MPPTVWLENPVSALWMDGVWSRVGVSLGRVDSVSTSGATRRDCFESDTAEAIEGGLVGGDG